MYSEIAFVIPHYRWLATWVYHILDKNNHTLPRQLTGALYDPAKRKENERSDGSAPYSFSHAVSDLSSILSRLSDVSYFSILRSRCNIGFLSSPFPTFLQPALQTVLSFLENRLLVRNQQTLSEATGTTKEIRLSRIIICHKIDVLST